MTDNAPVRRSPVPMSDCNLSRSFELIGDRWTLMILRSALNGLRRFDDFQAELDIPRTVLSSRLAGLVESGIMERRDYREAGQRTRVEYPLTDMGRTLGLPFMAMTAWGDKWLGEGVMPLSLRSKSTGKKITVAYVDEKGRKAKLDDIEVVVDLGVLKKRRRKRTPA